MKNENIPNCNTMNVCSLTNHVTSDMSNTVNIFNDVT